VLYNSRYFLPYVIALKTRRPLERSNTRKGVLTFLLPKVPGALVADLQASAVRLERAEQALRETNALSAERAANYEAQIGELNGRLDAMKIGQQAIELQFATLFEKLGEQHKAGGCGVGRMLSNLSMRVFLITALDFIAPRTGWEQVVCPPDFVLLSIKSTPAIRTTTWATPRSWR